MKICTKIFHPTICIGYITVCSVNMLGPLYRGDNSVTELSIITSRIKNWRNSGQYKISELSMNCCHLLTHSLGDTQNIHLDLYLRGRYECSCVAYNKIISYFVTTCLGDILVSYGAWG